MENEVNMSENKLDPKYEQRIHEIEKRIRELTDHQQRWARAGRSSSVAGLATGNMINQANTEITELENERRRILDGTQQVIDAKKEQLEKLKQELESIKKYKLFERKGIKDKMSNIQEEINDIIKR